MSYELDQKMLSNMAALMPEIDGLQENDRSRWLGGIALDKPEVYRRIAAQDSPKYRRGYYFNVTKTMRFRLVEFPREGGGTAYAITLVVPEDPEEYFAGWVAASRHSEAKTWVESFNRDLDELRATWFAARGVTGEP